MWHTTSQPPSYDSCDKRWRGCHLSWRQQRVITRALYAFVRPAKAFRHDANQKVAWPWPSQATSRSAFRSVLRAHALINIAMVSWYCAWDGSCCRRTYRLRSVMRSVPNFLYDTGGAAFAMPLAGEWTVLPTGSLVVIWSSILAPDW